MDKIDPPLGFGEVQAIDLTHWKGSRRDPFFKDLCAAIQAKREGREVPPARGYAERMRRRLMYSTLSFALLAIPVAFGLDFLGLQNRSCTIPVLQPAVSDLCGALGLGDRPAKSERLSWESLQPGSCEDLREHIDFFPEDVYADEASRRLAARREIQIESWVPAAHRLTLFVGQQTNGLQTEETAKKEALDRGAVSAERLCKGFSATAPFRYVSSSPDAQSWNCESVNEKFACGFEGEAVCQLESREIQVQETCGDGEGQ